MQFFPWPAPNHPCSLAVRAGDYLPCYRSVASTGHGVCFGIWEPHSAELNGARRR